MALSAVVVLTLLPVLSVAADHLGCVDPAGKQVDWYVLYKLPRLKDSGDVHVAGGVGYMFLTSDDQVFSSWQMADHGIDSNISATARTLASVYSTPQRKSLRYIFYNDEHPNGPTTLALGHTKGVVAFEDDAGFWLVHSVPHFPPPPGQEYAYPSTGHTYGQSVLCLSLPNTQSESVAQQLLFNEPFIYAGQQGAGLVGDNPLFERVIEGKVRSHSPWFNTLPLMTVGGTIFYSYAKSRAFGKDLYEDFVAPAQKTSLLTETWMNGPRADRIHSNCTIAYPVRNIDDIAAKPTPQSAESSAPLSFDFSSTHDHSKWAVSTQHDTPVVCVGDINRMTTQEIRGGGTVCVRNYQLWQRYVQLVKEVEPCPSQKPINVYRRRP